jgi:hypothetical protein
MIELDLAYLCSMTSSTHRSLEMLSRAPQELSMYGTRSMAGVVFNKPGDATEISDALPFLLRHLIRFWSIPYGLPSTQCMYYRFLVALALWNFPSSSASLSASADQ